MNQQPQPDNYQKQEASPNQLRTLLTLFQKTLYISSFTFGGGFVMIFWQLFLSFIQVGLFSIGGGYAAIPLIQSQVVAEHGWMTMSEFTDLVTIAEMTPGPIAINSATFIGTRIAGPLGAIIATFGCVLPSCIIVSLLFFIYTRYKNVLALQSILAALRPAVVALIASAGLFMFAVSVLNGDSIATAGINPSGLMIFAIAFFILRRFRKNPIAIMIGCGVAQLVIGIVI